MCLCKGGKAHVLSLSVLDGTTVFFSTAPSGFEGICMTYFHSCFIPFPIYYSSFFLLFDYLVFYYAVVFCPIFLWCPIIDIDTLYFDYCYLHL